MIISITSSSVELYIIVIRCRYHDTKSKFEEHNKINDKNRAIIWIIIGAILQPIFIFLPSKLYFVIILLETLIYIAEYHPRFGAFKNIIYIYYKGITYIILFQPRVRHSDRSELRFVYARSSLLYLMFRFDSHKRIIKEKIQQ